MRRGGKITKQQYLLFSAGTPGLRAWKREIRRPSAPGLFKVSAVARGTIQESCAEDILGRVFGRDILTAREIINSVARGGSAAVIRGRSFDAAVDFADRANTLSREMRCHMIFQVAED